MAIINCTPDSFHASSRAETVDRALELARRAMGEGADLIDIGAESTRPGAQRVDADEQIKRAVPVIEAIRAHSGALSAVPISIDTTLSAVARAALDAGADAVNDVSAGREDPALLELAAERGAGLVLMHRLTTPGHDRYSDQYNKPPAYEDVVQEVAAVLQRATDSALAHGASPSAIVWDPGLGFGKGIDDTLKLIRSTPVLASQGYPVLSALSRKSFVGRLSLGRDSQPAERLSGTLALSTLHLSWGARIFRVHDVGPHRQALDAAWALLG